MTTNLKGTVFVLACLTVAVAVIIQMMSNSKDQPYYSPSVFNPFLPLTAVYTCLAHIWIFGFNRQRDIVEPLPAPSAEKKIAIVTGSNTGIGYETARTLVVDYGWEVILACRNKEKAIHAMVAINKEAAGVEGKGGASVVLDQPLDLSDFESIRTFSSAVKTHWGEDRRIDVLINNAGRNTSGKSGKLDLMFQSNFLGHFLLTNELMDKLKNGGRIINLSSVMHHFAGSKSKSSSIFWRSIATYNPSGPVPESYAVSKLASILFTSELNRRYASTYGIQSMAVSPGTVASDIWRDFPRVMQLFFGLIYLTSRQGSAPVVAAAVRNDWGGASYLQPYWLPQGGEKEGPPLPIMVMLGPYVGFRPTTPRLPQDGGIEASKSLWKMSEELTGCLFPTAEAPT